MSNAKITHCAFEGLMAQFSEREKYIERLEAMNDLLLKKLGSCDI